MGLSSQLAPSAIARPGVIANAAARPASPYDGQVVYQQDTDQAYVWNGSAWVLLSTGTANPPGLELVTSCTASSVGGTSATASGGIITIGSGNTSVTVSNAFSSTYDVYRVQIEVNDTNGTASNTLQLSGITGSNYFTGGSYGSWGGATQTGYGPAVMTSWVASANTVNGANTQITWEVANPNVARRKHGTIFSQAGNGHMSMNVICSSTSTSTGFVLAKAGDTMTGGTIRVYGYRNS